MRHAYCDNHPEKKALVSIRFTWANIGPHELLGHGMARGLGVFRNRDLCEECAGIIGIKLTSTEKKA